TLRDSRGKILFLMDNGGSKRAMYRDGRPSLEGRVLFTNANPGDPDAAFVKRNGPIGSSAEIMDLVSRGYLVRTRADADTIQARGDDPTQRDAALASGAQFVSTDYPVPNLDFSGYFVEIPGGMPAACNPINAPAGCRNGSLERLRP
ncbi:MAG: phosphatidylinositol-specific phospholipase C1-like protein, partial [Myxococcales bacterium]|nr:phosphatidylinositol-specific phospholipase C1-like protein [Myxococcales bacterium]